MTSLFSGVRSTVDKATSPEDAPTPGFLYQELVKYSFQSPSTCDELLDVLLARLQHSSPNARLKALRCLRHLLDKGSRQLRRELQRKTDRLRDCTSFRGPPDPLRGDAPYRLVREEAQSLLNALFDTLEPEPAPSHSYSPAYSPSASSFSSASSSSTFSSSSSSYSSSGRGRYEGHGNWHPSEQPRGYLEAVVESVSAGAARLMSLVPGLSQGNSQHDLSNYSLPPGSGFDIGGSSTSYSAYRAPSPPRTHDSSGSSSATRTPAPLGGWGPATTSTAPASTHASGEALELERRLVDEVTAAGGVRTGASREVLANFVSRSSSLGADGWRLAEALEDTLEDPAVHWASRLRALQAIEALLQSPASTPAHTRIVADLTEFFRQYPEQLQQMRLSPQASLQDRALRILRLLRLEADAPAPAASSPDSPPPTSPPTALSPAAPHPRADKAAALFAGLDLSSPGPASTSPAPTTASAAASSPVAERTAPARRVRGRARPAAQSASAAPNPPLVPEASAPPAPAPATTSSPSPTPIATTSSLDELLGLGTPATPTTPSQAPANPGSAASLLLSTAAPASPTATATATASPGMANPASGTPLLLATAAPTGIAAGTGGGSGSGRMAAATAAQLMLLTTAGSGGVPVQVQVPVQVLPVYGTGSYITAAPPIAAAMPQQAPLGVSLDLSSAVRPAPSPSLDASPAGSFSFLSSNGPSTSSPAAASSASRDFDWIKDTVKTQANPSSA